MTDKPITLLEAERALIAHYDRLVKQDGNWDQPFLAGVGPEYFQASPRLLVVGKATAGWSNVEEPVTAEATSAHSAAFVQEPTAGAFFRHVQQLALGVASGVDPAAAARRIAWTNLARIGYAGGNPAGQAFDAQETLCRWLLAAELDWLRPDLVILLTGDYRHDLVSDFFDGIVWEYLPNAGHDAAWCGCWHGVRVVWTMHPQGKSLERLERERRAIAAWFAGTRNS